MGNRKPAEDLNPAAACPKCPKDNTDQCCVETGLEGSANKRLIEVSAVGQKERMVFGQQMLDTLSGILTALRRGRTEEEGV